MADSSPQNQGRNDPAGSEISAEELENVAGGMMDTNSTKCVEANIYQCGAAT